jgi:hypothetical protein
MQLDMCPLCKAIQEGQDSLRGKFCMKVGYEVVELAAGVEVKKVRPAVVVIEHGVDPSPEAVVEAMDMLGARSGIVEDIRGVAGHWGLYVKDGEWSAAGKSNVHDTEK